MRQFLCAIVFSSLIVPTAIGAETVDAVWQEQEVDFTFISLDMAYSCDVIEARFGMLLRHVGATDVHVTVPSCGAFKLPKTHHRILARFSTLVPPGDGDVDMVQATWTEVELGKGHPRSIDDHDCEVLEQFQKYLLPTVEHEMVEGDTGCGATRHSILGRLKLKVLQPAVADVAAENDE